MVPGTAAARNLTIMTTAGPENGSASVPPVSPDLPPQPAQGKPATVAPTQVAPVKPTVPVTRTGTIWVTVCAAALLTVALIIFLVQNTRTVRVHFLGLAGSTSLALMLLIAAVGGVLLTLVIGSIRILQLRRTLRKRNQLP
jgi:uncharacterized integral membrane protein